MTKTQKIWLWISVAMFVVPEVLWSPVSNFLYTFYKGGNIPIIFRDNFLMSSDYRGMVIIIIFLQSFAALTSFILLYKSLNKGILKISLCLFTCLLTAASFCVFLILLLTYWISFP